jgi:hypothetical protein
MSRRWVRVRLLILGRLSGGCWQQHGCGKLAAVHLVGAIREEAIGSSPPPRRRSPSRNPAPRPPATAPATAFQELPARPHHGPTQCARSAATGMVEQEYTICTAIAPDAVFTIRTYSTGPPYDPILVPKSSHQKSGTHRSLIVSQVRLHEDRIEYYILNSPCARPENSGAVNTQSRVISHDALP